MDDPVPSHLIHNDADLIAAATRQRPEIDNVEATVLSGAAWRIGFCTAGCDCMVRRAAAETLEEDIARLGLRRKPGSPEVLQKSAALRGRRRNRDLQTLLDLAAWSLRPAVMDWCETRRAPVLAGFGLSAYDLWADALSGSLNEFAHLLEGWGALRRNAGLWLLRRAGQQRTPYAVRLRRAGSRFQEEADVLEALIQGPTVRWVLQQAQEYSAVAIDAVTEAALMEAGIPSVVRSVLLEDTAEALTGTALQEVLYLARAASRPLRVLAARRLAGGQGPQVEATLGQLLWEPYSPLADTALWALGRSHPDSISRTALGTARGMARESPSSLRVPLLCTAEPDGLGEIVAALAEEGNLATLRPEVRAWLGERNGRGE